MRGSAASMTVLRPSSASEAVSLFKKHPAALPLAGGTDLMVSWNMGLLNGKSILDLSSVAQWRRIEPRKEGVRIGALVTHLELQRHPVIRRELPLLVDACAVIGAVAIQNRGTLGGNIANASPAADTFPPLSVYGAVVRVVSATGPKEIPVSEFFAGAKKTVLGTGELIAAVDIPFSRPRPSRGYFRKVGTRAAQALSKIVAAGLIRLSRTGTVEDVRFAVGSAAPTVRRLKAAEGFLQGRRLTPAAIKEAAGLAGRDIAPIDDIRSTAAYRLGVTRNLLEDFLKEAL